MKETEILVQEKASPRVSMGTRGSVSGSCTELQSPLSPIVPNAGPVSPPLPCSLLRGTLPEDQQCLCILCPVSIPVHGSPPYS